MRHIVQKHNKGCGIACLAMVAKVSYNEAAKYLPVLKDGFYSGQIVTALKKVTRSRKWKLYPKTVPVFLRYYVPRIDEGIVVLAFNSATAAVYSHFVAISGNRIFDPAEKRSITLDEAKRDKNWRYWMVSGEIGRS